ncbi:MAG TPA: hypothetical protein GXX28_01145 [Firmicutes bacterium]|nr:hypothetical protein [Bacillota bacterium]
MSATLFHPRTRRKPGGGHLVVRAVLAAVMMGAVAAAPARAAISSSQLIEEPAWWDGQTITYRGEVIGDIMRRGRSAVVNVNDGTYALGVWLPARMASEIEFVGRYGVKGDTVLVRGVYHRACPEHGGDPDLHAEWLEVVASGGPQTEPFHRREALTAAFFLALGLALTVWERRRRPPEAEEPEF